MARAVSGIAMEWARRVAVDKHLPAGVAHTLVCGLAYHAGARSGKTWVGVDTLAAELHVAPYTITRHLAAIERAGVLEVIRRRGWTTVWLFPAEARWTPHNSGANPPQKRALPPTNCEGDKGVTRGEQARGAPPAGKSTFLPGTGWV